MQALVYALIFCLAAVLPAAATLVGPVRAEQSLAHKIATLDSRYGQAGSPSITCEACETLVSLIQIGVQTNATVDFLEKLVIGYCVEKKIYGGYLDVCTGMIQEMGPEVVYIFSHKYLVPKTVCTKLKLCNDSQSTFVSDPRLDSSVVLTNPGTPSPATPRPVLRIDLNSKSAAGDLGTIVHVSDIHVDLRYAVGTNAGCGKPLCCRVENGPGTNASDTAGPFGDYRCDLSPEMYDSFLKKVASLTPTPDFIIITGDAPPHDVWEQSREENTGAAAYLAERMLDLVPNVPFYQTVGNHEAFPVNQFEGPPADDWLWNALAGNWSKYLSSEAVQQLQYAGYYTDLIPGTKLRIVSLNTNYCNTGNFWLLLNDTDLGNQLQWWRGVMAQAQANNERVYVIAHLAPAACFDAYAWEMHDILEQYKDTVAAQLYGHTHYDEFHIFNDRATNTKPFSVALIPGSLTTYQNFNPSFRVYTYNRTSGSILDWQQYTANVTEANLKGYADWAPTYTPLTTYGFNALAPGDFQNFISRMQTNDTLFNEFAFNAYRNDWGPCTGKCKKSLLCRAATANNDLYKQCLNQNGSDWHALPEQCK